MLTALLLAAAPTVPARAASNGCPDPTRLPPTPFEDLVSTAHRSAVICASWYGIVNGTATDRFSPQRAVRRGQMAAMLARLVIAAEVPLPSEPPQPFSDVDDSVHRDAIAQVAALGLVEGRADGRFRPDATLSRGQVATLLVRTAAVFGIEAVDVVDAFADDDGSVHEAAIDEAVELRLARGRTDGRFEPEAMVLREQAASFVARLIRVLVHRGALKDRPIPPFSAQRTPVPDAMRARMRAVSWRPGCPVGLDDLTLLRVTHWDYRATPRRGHLIVARTVAADVVDVFDALYRARFQIRRMRPIHTYDRGEPASLADNNSSAFNCRPVTGGTAWSEHSYGIAIDINPRQNPYVKGTTILPRDAGPWVARTPVRRGMITRGGPVVAAFEAIGWRWGGDYRSLKDYQHFSSTGR